MTIEVPSNFLYRNSRNPVNNYAYEEDGILYIKGNVSFEELMKALLRNTKNPNICHYCGKKIKGKDRTIDHKYPKDFGGISIPNNMVWCCSSCNSAKSNLTSKQYKVYLKIKDENLKKDYREDCLRINKNMQKIKGNCLPDEWLSFDKRTNILAEIYLNDMSYKGKKYKRIKSFYKKNKQFPRPIIISSNNFLLSGFLLFIFAKNKSKSKVQTIILENVVVVK